LTEAKVFPKYGQVVMVVEEREDVVVLEEMPFVDVVAAPVVTGDTSPEVVADEVKVDDTGATMIDEVVSAAVVLLSGASEVVVLACTASVVVVDME
jgi:phosphatidylglycerophosphatase A